MSRKSFFLHTLPVIVANTFVLLLILDGAAIFLEQKLSGGGSNGNGPEAVTLRSSERFYQPPPGSFFPFVLVRNQPNYTSQGVNTDSSGFRCTPHRLPEPDVLSIDVYGGSTVLGWGVPDSAALPAQLQRILREDYDIRVNVRNMGAATRNSTQSMIEFLLDLQTGHIPDMVLFYEGYNDGATAWFEQDAGLHLGYRRVKELLCGADSVETDNFDPLNAIALFRAVRLLASPESMMPVLVREANPLGRTSDPETLASSTMDVFTANCREIRAVASAFRIPVVIVWQPTLAAERKNLTPEEQEYLSRMDPDKVSFQRVLWDSAGKRSETGLYEWLGAVNRDVQREVYIDYCHMNTYGTGLVARAIVPLLLARMDEGLDSIRAEGQSDEIR